MGGMQSNRRSLLMAAPLLLAALAAGDKTDKPGEVDEFQRVERLGMVAVVLAVC